MKLSPAETGRTDSVLAPKASAALLVLIVGLGFFLRVYQLGEKSLWLDEIGQVLVAENDLFITIQLTKGHAAAPPLDYILTHISLYLTRSEFGLRLFAAVWGTLSIISVYTIGKYLATSKEIGLIAAAILAISPAHIQYSQELRFYSLLGFLNLLIILMILRLLRKQSVFNWFVLTACTAFGLYTHYYTFFTVFACGAILLVFTYFHYRKSTFFQSDWLIPQCSLRTFVAFTSAVLVAMLMILPWIIYAGSGNVGGFVFVQPPIEHILVFPIFGTHLPAHWVGFFVFPILVIAGVIIAIYRRLAWVFLPLSIILISAAGIILLDKYFSYFYSYRQLVHLLPLYLLLVAAGIYYLIVYVSKSQIVRIAILLIFFLVVLVSFVPSIKAYYDWPKAGWRETAEFISHANSRIPIITEPRGLNKYLVYYSPELQHLNIPSSYFEENNDDEARVWWLTTSLYSKPVVDSEEWEMIDVSSGFNLRLYYMGKTDHKTLIDETLNQGVNPRTIAYSPFLYEVQILDTELALDLSEQMLDSVSELSYSLKPQELSMVITRIGRLKYDVNQIENSIADLETALRYDQRNTEALNNLGYILLGQNRCADALAYMKRSVKLNPHNYWGFVFLGEAYDCQLEWGEAAEAYIDAYNLRPSSSLLLKAIEAHLADEDIASARQLFDQIQQEYPNSSDAIEAANIMTVLIPTDE